MKIVNENFEEIDAVEKFDFNECIKNIIKYISHYEIDSNLLKQMYIEGQSIIIEYTSGGKYSVCDNGKIRSFTIPSTTGAFETLLNVEYEDKGIKVTPGIGLRSKINSNIHNFVHELFHALSTRANLPYDEKGIYYIKNGLKVKYYNKDDEVVNSDYDFTALTEGVTELLTGSYLKERGRNDYHFQVIFSKILSSNDNSIFKAYFSRDDKDVIDFVNQFENNQSTMKLNNLSSMPKYIITDQNLIYKYLKSAIEYDLKFTPEENRNIELENIKKIVSELDEDLDYMLDEGSYIDIFDRIVSELYHSKKEQPINKNM